MITARARAAALVRVLRRRVRSVTFRRARRPGCLVLGEAPEAVGLATRLQQSGWRVALVGRPASEQAPTLARTGITVYERAGRDLLSLLLESADSVIVCGRNDEETLRLCDETERLAGTAPFPTVALFDTEEAAQSWRARPVGGAAVTRTELLVMAALRAAPPWLQHRATPPPVVIGQGPTASALVERIAVGWQQPGELRQVDVITADRTWADAAEARLGPNGLGLAHVAIDELPLLADDVVQRVRHRSQAWRAPSPRHATVAGPTVHVVDDLELAAAIAAALPDARVCAVVEFAPPELPVGVTVVARADVLTDPSLVLLTEDGRFEEMLFVEVASWPQDIPSLFGDLARRPERTSGGEVRPLAEQARTVQSAVRTVAEAAPGLMRGLGITVTSDGPSQQILLGPDELRKLRDALVEVVPPARDVEPGEHAQRALELSLRLPVLLARAGFTLRRPAEHRDALTADHIVELAPQAHAAYVVTARALGHATGSEVAHMGWGELDAFTRESNRAQIADVAAKLVSVGLTWRHADPPSFYSFSDEQLDELARLEHRRWEHFERRNGHSDHALAKPWFDLSDTEKEYDRRAILALPEILASVGLEIIDLGRKP